MSQVPCPYGYYCPEGSATPIRCPQGHYCGKLDDCNMTDAGTEQWCKDIKVKDMKPLTKNLKNTEE